MAMSKETKMAIQASLRMGTPVKDVAEKFDVKMPTVYAIKRKMDDTKDDETVSELASIPREVVHHIVEEAKTKQPELAETFEAVEAGADGLKKLDMKFQETVTLALNRFNQVLNDEDTPLKDVKMIIDTTASAYEKVFNSGTNIHIGDKNTNSTQQLTIFKNKMGV